MNPGFLNRLIGRGDDDEPSTEAQSALPFRERVENFWDWFEGQSQRLHAEVQTGKLNAAAFTAAVDAAELGLPWEFCKADEVREGFALSGDSNTTKCFMASFAIERGKERAALKEHWVLHPWKQASDQIAGASVQLGEGTRFEFSDFLFAVDFDPESEELSIGVHHPMFKELDEDPRWHLTWLAIDNALGQALVKAWVGTVEPLESPTDKTRHGIDALRTQSLAALKLHDLDPDRDPLQTYTSYERREQSDADLTARGDVIAGTTRNFDSILELENEVDEIEMNALGAALAYIVLPVDDLGERGQSVEARADLEEQIADALSAVHAGEVTGGATGTDYAYIDLLLFDEDRTKTVCSELLTATSTVTSAALRYFSPSRSSEQSVLTGDWNTPPPGYVP